MLPISARIPAELKALLVTEAKENDLKLGEYIALSLSMNRGLESKPSKPSKSQIDELNKLHKQEIAGLKKKLSEATKAAKSKPKGPKASSKELKLQATLNDLEKEVFFVSGPSRSHAWLKSIYQTIKARHF